MINSLFPNILMECDGCPDRMMADGGCVLHFKKPICGKFNCSTREEVVIIGVIPISANPTNKAAIYILSNLQIE